VPSWFERTRFQKIADVPVSPLSYVDTDVVAGTRYCYTVKAVVGGVVGKVSSSSCATPTASTWERRRAWSRRGATGR